MQSVDVCMLHEPCQAYLHLFINHHLEYIRGPTDFYMQVGIWVYLLKLMKGLRQNIGANHPGSGHVQDSRRSLTNALQHLPATTQGFHRPLGKWQERLSHIRQPNSSCCTVKQDHAHLVFQGLHSGAHGRLRYIQGIRRPTKAAPICSLQKRL